MSTTHQRAKRTPAARTGPVRNSLFPPPKPAGGTAPGPGGVLENGVKTAYAVIDEYIRRGREAARHCKNPEDNRGPMNDYKNNYGNPFAQMPNMAEQMMGAMRFWTTAWSAFMPPGFAQQTGFDPMAIWGQTWQKPAAAPAVSIHVAAQQPVEVTATVKPGCDSLNLDAPTVHIEGGTHATLDHILITREHGGVRVSVKVPAGQAAGRYSGPIRDRATGADVGRLTVVVAEAAGK